MPVAMQPGLTGVAGRLGRSSASDTPRSMSGLWSQCPWGKPRPYGGAMPFDVLSAGGAGKAGWFMFPCAIHPPLVVIVTGSRRAEVVAPYGGI